MFENHVSPCQEQREDIESDEQHVFLSRLRVRLADILQEASHGDEHENSTMFILTMFLVEFLEE